MNKKIEQLKNKLEEAKRIRERNKVRYDAQVLILEGHRNTTIALENLNHQLMSEFSESDRAIGEINKQLQQAIDEAKIKSDETETQEQRAAAENSK